MSPASKSAEPAPIGLLVLSLIALVLGICAGFGSVFFRAVIGLIHNVAFLGEFSFFYNANTFTPPSPWGLGVVLVPVIGAVFVNFLIVKFAPEARGHGVPEVMDAIYYNEGRIRGMVATIKSLTSALSIGTGASVGREGPIIQIGASVGSWVGQVISMAPWQRITLVAAGAGAGVAGTFNTPLGGVMFAIEMMMPEVSTRTFVPVALATGAATFVSRAFLGIAPAFYLPQLPTLSYDSGALVILLLYGALGIPVGIGAAAFVRGLHRAVAVFEKIPNSYLRHCVGMFGVGIMMYLLFVFFGHYYVEGVGYSTIEAVLTGALDLAPLLVLLFFCKLGATLLSLGSGASGGVFSPSLFLGAVLGAAFGIAADSLAPGLGISPISFAVVGMAAMVGGATGAAMTAVTMIFEMTQNYSIVMPMIIAVAISLGVRRVLSRENIYTIKLVARRHFIPKALHANMFLVRHAGEVMDRNIVVLPASTGLDQFLRQAASDNTLRHLVVTKADKICGVQTVDAAFRHGLEKSPTDVNLGDIVKAEFAIAQENDTIFHVLRRMHDQKADLAVVVKGTGVWTGMPSGEDVLGTISTDQLADSVIESVLPYSSG